MSRKTTGHQPTRRQNRRKLINETGRAEKKLLDIGIKFMMAIRDERADEWTYAEIYKPFNDEWMTWVNKYNQTRKEGQYLINPGTFADTFGPREYDNAKYNLLQKIRSRGITPQEPYGSEANQPEILGSKETDALRREISPLR